MLFSKTTRIVGLAAAVALAGPLTGCGEDTTDTNSITEPASTENGSNTGANDSSNSGGADDNGNNGAGDNSGTNTPGNNNPGNTPDNGSGNGADNNGSDQPSDGEEQLTIAEIASGDESFSTLVTALDAAGLVDTFAGEGNFTVFAPTNAAFEALPEGVLDALLADTDALTKVLTYHVLPNEVMSTDLQAGKNFVATIEGSNAVVEVADGAVTLNRNKAAVFTADIDASNGVIHAIDKVILPPATLADVVYASADHTTLFTALDAAGLTDALDANGDKTVFAPSNAAFEALPEGVLEGLLADVGTLTNVLTYHVVPAEIMSTDLSAGKNFTTTLEGSNAVVEVEDGVVTINRNKATVYAADLDAKNGVIHAIDQVILPPSTLADKVYASQEHTTLFAALTAAGLVDALDADGDKTIFAPNNAAFDALPEGLVEELLADIPALTNILTYHVVGTQIMSTDLAVGKNFAATLQGANAVVEVSDAGVTVNRNKAAVYAADLDATNGVIHAIDQVILPPATLADTIYTSNVHTTLFAALEAADLTSALDAEEPKTIFAPTDDAFAELPEGTVASLLEDIPVLQSILLTHVVGSQIESAAITAERSWVSSLAGHGLAVEGGESVTVYGEYEATVTVADLPATNGILHVVDAVILPPVSIAAIARSLPSFSVLTGALEQTGLFNGLADLNGSYTVFAPDNAAFQPLIDNGTIASLTAGQLQTILLYHVVGTEIMAADIRNEVSVATTEGRVITLRPEADGGVTINNTVFVTTADLNAGNGVIHAIDSVLIP